MDKTVENKDELLGIPVEMFFVVEEFPDQRMNIIDFILKATPLLEAKCSEKDLIMGQVKAVQEFRPDRGTWMYGAKATGYKKV